MNIIDIRHTTSYRFTEPVTLLPHRLMLRPREGRDLRLLSSKITVTPDAVLSWAQDVFGNAVATASFSAVASNLLIESCAQVELGGDEWPVFDIAVWATSYPFRYADHEWIDLGALAMPQEADPAGHLRAWAQSFVRSNPTDTLSLLKDLNAGVPSQIRYQSRDAEGTQSPVETLNRGLGSCRDFAVLFAEAARTLGFGVRIASGYLYDPDRKSVGSACKGSTHAWAEVFIPGAGWIAFDPTNGRVGGHHLIPVAVVRDIRQASPVSGSFFGSALASISVQVVVSAPQ